MSSLAPKLHGPSYRLGGSHNISGGQGDAAVPFGSSFEQTRPSEKDGASALLAKPVCGMMGSSIGSESVSNS